MNHREARRGSTAPLIGVLPGEGCGPELIGHSLDMLAAASPPAMPAIEFGAKTGSEAVTTVGAALSDEVVRFCHDIFDRGGAILAGAAGDRFVYDARREFRLFAKLNPIHSFRELRRCGRWRPPEEPVDLVLVRETLGDVYHSRLEERESNGRVTTLTFSNGHAEIDALTSLAAGLAGGRRGKLTVVTKEAGVPELHRVWVDHAGRAARAAGVELDVVDVDVAAYLLLREPESFDVVATSNCFGDILSDLGGHIMGSRGNTYGASYSAAGAAIYQTNHGSAQRLKGTDRVNPAGQILSLAMLVREQFGWDAVAQALVDAVRATWQAGIVTPDLEAPGMTPVGTREWTRASLHNLRGRSPERLAWHPA
jgi:isocitrate/isopropylmalate dehydrogenase